MSWPDAFPIFSEEQLDDYYDHASPAEKAEQEEWYGIERIINPRPEAREIVSISLFWKPVQSGTRDYPEPTREILINAVELGYADRYNPWDHYVAPLLDLTPTILQNNPHLSVRVHLAKDLEFLVEELTEAGCEIALMKSSSIKQAPGSLWRFLPLSEEGKTITVTDTDRLGEIETDLARSRMLEATDVGTWRVPIPNDLNHELKVCYIPFIGCQFGVKGGLLEVDELLKAFTWSCIHDKVEANVILPNCGPLPMARQTWPDYCFDEFFMAVAAYPRLAQDGMMTFIPGNGSSQLMTLDIEYTTWGNPASEVIYFPSGACCGQEQNTTSESPDLEVIPGPQCANPKVAFIFPSGSETSQAKIWEDYLAEAESAATSFSSSADSSPQGDLETIRESLTLLRDALKNEELTHFIILPTHAVPIRSFPQLIRNLCLDPRSRMTLRSWEDERKTNPLRAQLVENLDGIRKEHAHFHSPWVALSRSDATLLCSKDLTAAFESCHCSAECFYATTLSALGKPPLQNLANRAITQIPQHFDPANVTPNFIANISESGSFFATGFSSESNIGEYRLHLPS